LVISYLARRQEMPNRRPARRIVFGMSARHVQRRSKQTSAKSDRSLRGRKDFSWEQASRWA
jgi:hypothetical protein